MAINVKHKKYKTEFDELFTEVKNSEYEYIEKKDKEIEDAIILTAERLYRKGDITSLEKKEEVINKLLEIKKQNIQTDQYRQHSEEALNTIYRGIEKYIFVERKKDNIEWGSKRYLKPEKIEKEIYNLLKEEE